MLEPLFGTKNIERILLFLFINGKSYGTELARALKTPLTPLQKGLTRLEKGGVLLSYFEGRTKLYRLNPAYPPLQELEALLKKAYTLLPTEEKRRYYLLKTDSKLKKFDILYAAWERLQRVQHVSLKSQNGSLSEGAYSGKGQGEVTVIGEGGDILIFQEKGTLTSKEGEAFSFSNVFRWTLDRKSAVITLEHLRRGWNHPVYLFDLAPQSNHSLASVDAHHCGGDSYMGQLLLEPSSVRLHWRVIGPKKNEELDYYYS
ncbi:DUF6314 family protein [Estrella lausannensis]|nr:DUF6314 family protein [Estrella lausannensis]